MTMNFKYLAWRLGFFTPTDPITRRVYELKAKGFSETETINQIKEEFRLRVYGTDGKEVTRGKTSAPPLPRDINGPRSIEEFPEGYDHLAAAKKDFQERLKNDPELAVQLEAYRVEKNEKVRVQRAAKKVGQDPDA